MIEWVLILFLYAGPINGEYTKDVLAIENLKSQEECRIALIAVIGKIERSDYKLAGHACVPETKT